MTQKCCICKVKTVAHWIPADPGDKDTMHYPVCSSERCKFQAWRLPSEKKNKQLPVKR